VGIWRLGFWTGFGEYNVDNGLLGERKSPTVEYDAVVKVIAGGGFFDGVVGRTGCCIGEVGRTGLGGVGWKYLSLG